MNRWNFKEGWKASCAELIDQSSRKRCSGAVLNFYMDSDKKFSRYIMTQLGRQTSFRKYVYRAREVAAPYPGISVVFGKACVPNIVHPALKNKSRLIYIDHAYFDRGYRYGRKGNGTPPNFRVIINNIHQVEFKERDSDRFDKFNITIDAWKKNGKHIVICPPTGYLTQTIDLRADWAQASIQTIKDNSDRSIVIRPKPGITTVEPYIKLCKQYKNVTISENTKEKPLSEDIEDAWALVAPASAASIEAIIAGVPVFTGGYSPAKNVGLQDLTRIEEPIYPNRLPLLYNLAYSQFSIEEIESGFMLEFLIKDNPRFFKGIKREK